MGRLSLCLLALIGTMTLTAAAPHHHNDDPAVVFLKQLRKARKHGGTSQVSFGNREDDPSIAASSVDPTTTSILFPQSSRAPAINLPAIPQPSPSSPQDIQRVNSGLSTILQGVRSFDLGQILRGAFIFPRNENVKSVANTVLDNIFGPIGTSSSSSTSDSDAPSFRN